MLRERRERRSDLGRNEGPLAGYEVNSSLIVSKISGAWHFWDNFATKFKSLHTSRATMIVRKHAVIVHCETKRTNQTTVRDRSCRKSVALLLQFIFVELSLISCKYYKLTLESVEVAPIVVERTNSTRRWIRTQWRLRWLIGRRWTVTNTICQLDPHLYARPTSIGLRSICPNNCKYSRKEMRMIIIIIGKYILKKNVTLKQRCLHEPHASEPRLQRNRLR